MSCTKEGYINCISLTADNSRIVTAHFNNEAVVWDGRHGEQLHVLSGHGDKVESVSIAADGSLIATCSNNVVTLWDGNSYQKMHELMGHTALVKSVSASSDGAFVISGGADKTVMIWDSIAGRRLSQVNAHTDIVLAVQISSDSSIFISGSKDMSAIIWDFKSKRILHILKGHIKAVVSLCISRDGTYVVTGSEDTTARIWAASSGKEIGILSKHTNAVTDVSMSLDGSLIVTASMDGTAIAWETSTRRVLQVLVAHSRDLHGAAIYSDKSRIVTGGSDKQVLFWDINGPERRYTLDTDKDVSRVCSSLDGSTVVTAFKKDNTVTIWDGSTYKIRHILRGHTEIVESVDVSLDGSIVVTGSQDKTAIVWNGNSGDKLRVLSGHSQKVSSVCISSDASILVTCHGLTATLWDRKSYKQLHSIEKHTKNISAVKICLHGRKPFIATGSIDKTAILWDISRKNQVKLRHILQGHTHNITSLSINHDGSCIVTSSCDYRAIVWDADSGEQLQVLNHDNWVKDVCFICDGRQIITCSKDKTSILWDWHSATPEKTLLANKRLFGFSHESVDACCMVFSDVLLLVDGIVHITSTDCDENDAFYPIWDDEHCSVAILSFINNLSLVPCPSAMSSNAYKDYIEHVPEDSIKTKGAQTYEGYGTWIHKCAKSPVDSYVVPIKNIVGYNSKFLYVAIKHSENVRKHKIFENPVINAVLDFKWKIVESYFMNDCYLVSFKSMFFLLNCLFPKNYLWNLEIGIFIMTCFLVIYSVMKAICRIWKIGFKDHLSNNWNIICLLSYICSTIALGFQFFQLIGVIKYVSYKPAFFACALPLLLAEILKVLVGFKNTGNIIRMLIKIMDDIKYFVAILGLVIIFFCGSFVVLFESSENPEGYKKFGMPQFALIQVYGFVYGSYNVDTMLESSSPFVAVLIGSIFMFFVVIVMLNILIAIISEKYSYVRENENAECSYGKAKLIAEYEKLIPDSLKQEKQQEWYPKYLHVLKQRDIE